MEIPENLDDLVIPEEPAKLEDSAASAEEERGVFRFSLRRTSRRRRTGR